MVDCWKVVSDYLIMLRNFKCHIWLSVHLNIENINYNENSGTQDTWPLEEYEENDQENENVDVITINEKL